MGRLRHWIIGTWLIALTLPVVARDTVELKNDSVLEGELLEITDEKLTIRIGDEAIMTISLKDVKPWSVCYLRKQRMKPDDVEGRFALAQYCMETGLFSEAWRLYRRLLELAPQRREEILPKIAEAAERDAEQLYLEGLEALKQEQYDLALKKMSLLTGRHPESNFVEAARKAIASAAASLQKKNVEQEEAMEAERREQRQQALAETESALQARFDKAVGLLQEVAVLNAEALSLEVDESISKADRRWRQAVEAALEAEANFRSVLDQTRDVDRIAAAKEKTLESQKWLTVLYNSLGQMWAVQLNYKEALYWLNETLKLDPTNPVATHMKLTLNEARIRAATR